MPDGLPQQRKRTPATGRTGTKRKPTWLQLSERVENHQSLWITTQSIEELIKTKMLWMSFQRRTECQGALTWNQQVSHSPARRVFIQFTLTGTSKKHSFYLFRCSVKILSKCNMCENPHLLQFISSWVFGELPFNENQYSFSYCRS